MYYEPEITFVKYLPTYNNVANLLCRVIRQNVCTTEAFYEIIGYLNTNMNHHCPRLIVDRNS